jgi:hypothetical protein
MNLQKELKDLEEKVKKLKQEIEAVNKGDRYDKVIKWLAHKDVNPQFAAWFKNNVTSLLCLSEEQLSNKNNRFDGNIDVMKVELSDKFKIILTTDKHYTDPYWIFEDHRESIVQRFEIKCRSIGKRTFNPGDFMCSLFDGSVLDKLFFYKMAPCVFLDYLMRIFCFTDRWAGYYQDRGAVDMIAATQLRRGSEEEMEREGIKHFWGGELRDMLVKCINNTATDEENADFFYEEHIGKFPNGVPVPPESHMKGVVWEKEMP